MGSVGSVGSVGGFGGVGSIGDFKGDGTFDSAIFNGSLIGTL